MAFKNASLKDYFMLKRETFSLDPFRDKDVYFGDSALATRITRRIQGDFVARGVPKFFVHGYYGSGKTHTLLHIAHLLETPPFAEMYPTEPIYLDIAPLTIKEQWKKIHGRFLDAIGLDRIGEAIEKAAEPIQGLNKAEGFRETGAVPFGDEALKVSQSEIFRVLLFSGGQLRQKSWEWMKGRKLSDREAGDIGTQKQLSEPQDFVNCLLNLGAMFQMGTGKKIVLLVDEAEAFTTVTNVDSIKEIKHAFRMLLENGNSVIGLVLATQVEGGLEEMGELFTDDDIQRRVGYEHGYIDLNTLLLGVNKGGEFVKKTLRYLVDQDMAAKVIEDEDLATDSTMFPFTEDAIEFIETTVRDNPDRALPSAILSVMSNSAIDAWHTREENSGHVLVDEALVDGAFNPGEPGA